MRTRPALSLVVALFVAFSARVGFADPPPAEFTISFDGDAAIWNPFEGFAACQTVSEETMCLSLEHVVCDGAGRCTGIANIEFIGALDGSASGPFLGRVRCIATPDPNDPICRVRLDIDDAFGSLSPCELSRLRLRMRGPVDADGLLHGSATTRICLTCPGATAQCGSGDGQFEYVLNPPTDWSLTVQSQPSSEDPLRLVGTANDSLGFSYSVVGELSVGNGVSTLRLRGDADTLSEGARIRLRNLVFHGEDLDAGTAYINVRGNKIRDKLDH